MFPSPPSASLTLRERGHGFTRIGVAERGLLFVALFAPVRHLLVGREHYR